MGFRSVALFVVAAGAGLTWFALPDAPRTDAMSTASIVAKDQRDYTVSNMKSRAACLLTRGRSLTVRSREVIAGKDCDSVWPGLAEARNWTENDDETVVLTDGHGEAILTLGLGDGVEFESLEPTNAMLALNTVQ